MRAGMTVIAVAAFASVLSATAMAADYVIDTKNAHASINFRIKHLGFSWIAGRFDKFSGTFSYDEKNPDASKVMIKIDTASVDTNHAERDKHLRAADLLDTEMFPEATFESTSVKASGPDKATITGKLTMHGVTKDVTLDAQRVGGGKDPWGGYRDGFTATTTLKLADFDITRDLGPFSKEVELTLDVEGVKQ